MIKRLYNEYRYELVAAGSGAIVMMLELVGARMVAPYLGTSLYVWTAIIGVILGALALGYWYGGRIADRQPTEQKLMNIMLLGAATIAIAMFVHLPLLEQLSSSASDVRISAVLASLILFAPAAVLLGIDSPYLVRLKLHSLQHLGASVGRLSAAGTIGSIAGTFIAGYWLIGAVGNQRLGFLLVAMLIALTFLLDHKRWVVPRIAAMLIAFIAPTYTTPGVVADIDSAYNRYQVTQTRSGIATYRYLVTDQFSAQSGYKVGSLDTLVFGYTKLFQRIAQQHKNDTMLVIGGGTFTFPSAAARQFPGSSIDAVEIDPALIPIAKDYFGYTPLPNLTIHQLDGRVFLNRTTNLYDIIYIDAFSSLTPPFQLASSQAVGHMRRSLQSDGLVVTNVVARFNDAPYLNAVTATYRQHFSYVNVYPVTPGIDPSRAQNLLLIATNDAAASDVAAGLFTAGPIETGTALPLVDDYAPIEQLINAR